MRARRASGLGSEHRFLSSFPFHPLRRLGCVWEGGGDTHLSVGGGGLQLEHLEQSALSAACDPSLHDATRHAEYSAPPDVCRASLLPGGLARASGRSSPHAAPREPTRPHRQPWHRAPGEHGTASAASRRQQWVGGCAVWCASWWTYSNVCSMDIAGDVCVAEGSGRGVGRVTRLQNTHPRRDGVV
jgi:hypothetical protein